ncbi:hypothetical protein Pst134EA_025808 [Puccinia striiformis f. sp. tritici]|uniref:hypothetical protein n=2 Tax=Puccinia striiformis f. sp. tritici TaxID=168172 RepID=UPI002007CEF0|nr:hypothetical protein Pst134EA_025808 [Puccinia striiformis f. sp. tritici]KAH9451867.1 hypothetical protein Pst134EA_025808 [Puccinia striiformis f. sp. tritici]
MVTLDQEGQNKSDEAVLAEIGYQQELKREWNLLQNFGVSFSIISVITGITTLFSTGLNVGGPAVMTWGWIGVSVMTVLVGLSMSEIVSAIPTSGGPYFWAAILAKPDKSALAAWITGWFNLVGQVAVTTGISYGCADLISSTAEIIHPDQYTATPGKIIGIYAALLISHGLLNTFGVGLLRLFNHSSIVLHSLGIGSLAIALLVKAQLHQSSQFVFFKFYDGTGGWGERASPAYVAACGILFTQYTITGFDASAHMSEETKNAAWSAPLGVLTSVIVSAIFGFGILLAFLFSMQDFEGTLNAPQPVFKILVDVFGGVGAQVAMSLIILCVWHCGLFSVTSNSRMMYAFARDGGLPPKIFGLVDRRFDCPINTVWLSVVLAFLLALPSLGSAVALTAATSIATIGLYISYGLPILLSVIWDERFRKGPFRLHRFSMPIRITSCLWITVITVFFCLPNATPITRETLNYTPVVLGVLIVWIVLSWIFWARRSFNGPMIHDDHKGDVAITLPEGHSTYKNDATPGST